VVRVMALFDAVCALELGFPGSMSDLEIYPQLTNSTLCCFSAAGRLCKQ
jgi:hypothetical protein